MPALPRAHARRARPSRWALEITKDSRGEYRWRLKSGNGQTIAISGEGFTTKASAKNGIEAVQRDAPGAKIDDQTD